MNNAFRSTDFDDVIDGCLRKARRYLRLTTSMVVKFRCKHRVSVIALLCAALMVAIDGSAYAADKPSSLGEAFHAYYLHEQRGDWEYVYSLRTTAFQAGVRKSDFVRAMRNNNRGWRLDDFRIVAYRIDGDRARILIGFRERPPADLWYSLRTGPKRYLEITQESIWVREAAGWRCARSPSEAHLPFTE